MTYETNALALAGAAYDKARERDAQIADLTRRVEALERDSHAPFDFTHLIVRLDALEKTVAIVPADPASGERIPDDGLHEPFKPCRVDLSDSGMTQWAFEDVANVAIPAFARVYHFIDEIRAMDDGRLIGIQFWGPPPAASGPRATDPASNEVAHETEPPKIITPGNALWAFGLAEEEVKRLRAENAGLRAALLGDDKVKRAVIAANAATAGHPVDEYYYCTERMMRAALAALANPTGVEGMDAPNHIMCIGWETIKRLAAGEAVWIDSIQAGAVADVDLLGVNINALLAALASPDKPEPPALCNYEPYEPVGECKVDRCRRLGYCPWAGKQP